MWCSRRAALASLVALTAIAYRIHTNITFVTRPNRPSVSANNPDKCALHPGPWGAEDFALTKLGGWAVFSSLDYELFPDEGTERCHDDPSRGSGGIWMFNIAELEPDPPQRVNVTLPDFHEEPCFLTHGLFLSNATDRLYVVTHHGTRWSSIEIFKVVYPPENDEEEGEQSLMVPPPPELEWVRSVRSDEFPAFGPNSVVEGKDPGEIYVTLTIPFGVPETGMKHPRTLLDRMKASAMVPMMLLGLRWTRILRCTFDPYDPSVPTVCADATGGTSSFVVANGVSISADRRTIFVCDTLSYAVDIFHRLAHNGALERIDRIHLDYMCDNLEWKDDEQELWVSSITNVSVALSNMERPPEEREAAPGGLSVARRRHRVEGATREGKSNEDGDDWEMRLVYNHDGSKLSGVSFGMAHGGRIILGSPSANGILVCHE